mgnify:CR=1 FL=1
MNNWKQMSDQAQAEWLALKFLGWSKRPIVDMYWEAPNGNQVLDKDLVDFFNSPAGMAVDQVN